MVLVGVTIDEPCVTGHRTLERLCHGLVESEHHPLGPVREQGELLRDCSHNLRPDEPVLPDEPIVDPRVALLHLTVHDLARTLVSVVALEKNVLVCRQNESARLPLCLVLDICHPVPALKERESVVVVLER